MRGEGDKLIIHIIREQQLLVTLQKDKYKKDKLEHLTIKMYSEYKPTKEAQLFSNLLLFFF